MSHQEPLSSADTAWLRMDERTNLMVITGVMTFDGPLDRERVKQTAAERLIVFDRFRQRVTHRDGTPRWEDDPLFDLDAHVHTIALPSPAGQKELEDLVADMMSAPLDPEKPLWEWHLVERFGGGSALINRQHHCIADGIALARLLLSLTDATPDAARHPAHAAAPYGIENPLWTLFRPAVRVAAGAVEAAEAFLHEGVEVLRHPARAIELVREGVDVAETLAKLTLMGADSPTMFKGPLGVKKRVAWTGGIALEEVKALGHAFDATVNDVLLNALAGALRRYLREHDRPIDGVEIRIVVPVDLRPIEEVTQFGNRFGLVYVELPLGIEDPVKRLREISRRTREVKGSSSAAVSFGVLQTMGMASSTLEHEIIDLFSRKATAVVTNVPGPRKKLYFAGRRLESMMFWVPQSGGIGLGVSILSYDHEICIGVTSDAGLVPDPHRLVEAMKGELAALGHALARPWLG
jgi:WS/DGAT/MGAT family acyltransferase